MAGNDSKMSRSATDLDDGKVATTAEELDDDFGLRTRLSPDEDSRLRTWRSPRPFGTRLEARQTASRSALEIHFVGSCSLQCSVRPKTVVPVEKPFHFSMKG